MVLQHFTVESASEFLTRILSYGVDVAMDFTASLQRLVYVVLKVAAEAIHGRADVVSLFGISHCIIRRFFGQFYEVSW